MFSYVSKLLRRLRTWLTGLWHRRNYSRIRILSESSSSRGRLVEVQRSLIQGVATWKFIPRGDSGWDLLVCLDRWDAMRVALRANFDPGADGPVEPYPSHVLSVIRIYRIPGAHGSIRTTLIYYGCSDLVRMPHGTIEDGDYKARKVIGAVVKALHRYPDDEIDWPELIEQALALFDEMTYRKRIKRKGLL